MPTQLVRKPVESSDAQLSENLRILESGAGEAAEYLKALAHELRLQAICYIGDGERSVSDIEARLGTTQSNISQHLGRMKDRGVLVCRKDGNQCFYRVKDPTTLKLVMLLRECFC